MKKKARKEREKRGGEGGVPKSICNLVCKSRRNEARPVKGGKGGFARRRKKKAVASGKICSF